jgi:hypothetical protein
MGVGAGVAGAAVAGVEAVATGEGDAVGAAVAVPLCDGVGWVVVPPHAATSAASASRLGATAHLEPYVRVMAEILLLGGAWALRQELAPGAGLAAPPSHSTLADHTRP